MNWISTNDKLPEEGAEVIIYKSDNETCYSLFQFNTFLYAVDDRNDDTEVLYWFSINDIPKP